MSTYDDAVVGKAAWELYVYRCYEAGRPCSETPWATRDERIVRPVYMAEVRTVLDAVADDPRRNPEHDTLRLDVAKRAEYMRAEALNSADNYMCYVLLDHARELDALLND